MRKIKEKTWFKLCCRPGKYAWFSDAFTAFPDRRACVPKLILGHIHNDSEILHIMRVSCDCPENFNATVICYTRIENEFLKTFHKPGFCPHLTYERRPSK